MELCQPFFIIWQQKLAEFVKCIWWILHRWIAHTDSGGSSTQLIRIYHIKVYFLTTLVCVEG